MSNLRTRRNAPVSGTEEGASRLNHARFEVRRNILTRRYRVVLVGSNGEPLSVSETLNSVAAVNVNVQAQLGALANVKHVDWT